MRLPTPRTGPKWRSRSARVVAMTAIGLTAIGLSACGGDDELTERTLTLTEGKITETPSVDVPPTNKISTGDRLISSKPLFDEAGENRVGRVYLDCAAVDDDQSVAMCTGMVNLEDGGLSFSETFDASANEEHIATINGGTGAYDGATGSLIAGVDGTNEYEFRLFLP
jgi:hypothetical protein